MSATPITATSITSALDNPIDLTTGVAADITNGNSTPNNGRLHLIIQNSAASADTVAVTRTEVVDEAALPVRDIAVAANKTVIVGPFATQVFSASLQYKAGLATTKFIPVTF